MTRRTRAIGLYTISKQLRKRNFTVGRMQPKVEATSLSCRRKGELKEAMTAVHRGAQS